jgi:hypothetical protein
MRRSSTTSRPEASTKARDSESHWPEAAGEGSLTRSSSPTLTISTTTAPPPSPRSGFCAHVEVTDEEVKILKGSSTSNVVLCYD